MAKKRLFTRAQIHEACRNATDFIEEHPKRYDFFCVEIPTRRTQKACLLGWLGYFLGMKPGIRNTDTEQLVPDVAHAFGTNASAIYVTMEIFGDKREPETAVKALRHIARTFR